MANGHAVALPLAEEPEQEESETAVGVAVADAAIAFASAMLDFAAEGAMTAATRSRGGTALARLALIRLDTLDDTDFDTTARTYGRQILLQRHGADLRQQFGKIPETVITELISHVLNISAKAVADERAFRRAMETH
jgi:hypothetical protein